VALSGTGGAYYRSSALIPNGLNFHDANTMHVWFRCASAPSTANFRGVMQCVGTLQRPHDQVLYNHTSATFNKSRGHRNTSSTYFAARMTSTPAVDTWHAWTSTYDGTNLRCYFNGSLEATTACGVASGNDVYMDVLALLNFAGALDSSSQWADGQVAEIGIWNAALSADEIGALALGFRPTRVRQRGLIFYAPGANQLLDHAGGRTLVNQAGTDTFTDHPRVF
jgi:hypothetical protein